MARLPYTGYDVPLSDTGPQDFGISSPDIGALTSDALAFEENILIENWKIIDEQIQLDFMKNGYSQGLYDRYQELAKEAAASGDKLSSVMFQQKAEELKQAGTGGYGGYGGYGNYSSSSSSGGEKAARDDFWKEYNKGKQENDQATSEDLSKLYNMLLTGERPPEEVMQMMQQKVTTSADWITKLEEKYGEYIYGDGGAPVRGWTDMYKAVAKAYSYAYPGQNIFADMPAEITGQEDFIMAFADQATGKSVQDHNRNSLVQMFGMAPDSWYNMLVDETKMGSPDFFARKRYGDQNSPVFATIGAYRGANGQWAAGVRTADEWEAEGYKPLARMDKDGNMYQVYFAPKDSNAVMQEFDAPIFDQDENGRLFAKPDSISKLIYDTTNNTWYENDGNLFETTTDRLGNQVRSIREDATPMKMYEGMPIAFHNEFAKKRFSAQFEGGPPVQGRGEIAVGALESALGASGKTPSEVEKRVSDLFGLGDFAFDRRDTVGGGITADDLGRAAVSESSERAQEDRMRRGLQQQEGILGRPVAEAEPEEKSFAERLQELILGPTAQAKGADRFGQAGVAGLVQTPELAALRQAKVGGTANLEGAEPIQERPQMSILDLANEARNIQQNLAGTVGSNIQAQVGGRAYLRPQEPIQPKPKVGGQIFKKTSPLAEKARTGGRSYLKPSPVLKPKVGGRVYTKRSAETQRRSTPLSLIRRHAQNALKGLRFFRKFF